LIAGGRGRPIENLRGREEVKRTGKEDWKLREAGRDRN